VDVPTIGRTVWALSIPLLFLEIGDALIHVTDTAFLGRIGIAELGAIALGDTAFELLIFPVVGLLEALQLVIARRTGERRPRDVGAIFARAFMLAAAVSVVLAAVVAAGAGRISTWLAESEQVAEPLEQFLQIAALGIPFAALNLAFGALYVGILRARVLVWATLVLVLTNLVLSYVFILGSLGAPRLGMQGAAISSVGAEVAAFLLFSLYTARDADLRRLGLFRWERTRQPVVRPLIRLSAPVSLQGLVGNASWFVFFIILERVSGELLAWSNVVFACYLVLMIPTEAFAEAAYTMVSNIIGSGHAERLRHVVRRTLAATFAVTAPVLLLVLVFPGTVLSVFSDDAIPLQGSETALRVVVVAMLVAIPAEMWMAAVLGTGDVDAALVIDLVFGAVIVMGAAAAALFDISLPYVWLSLPAAAIIAMVLAYARLETGRWRGHPV
jgi:multidrug resistance protein, MATE family